jgi:hypothetical protein
MFYKTTIILLISLFSFISTFDVSQYVCSDEANTQYDNAESSDYCTFVPSTSFYDYSDIYLINSTELVTNKDQCCSTCTSLQCDFFLFTTEEENNIKCNFYKSASPSARILLCSNAILAVGLPAA